MGTYLQDRDVDGGFLLGVVEEWIKMLKGYRRLIVELTAFSGSFGNVRA